MKFNFVQIKLNVRTVEDSMEPLKSALQVRGHLKLKFSKIIQEQSESDRLQRKETNETRTVSYI